MRLLQSKVNTKTILRPAGPLWVLKRCGTLVSQLMPSQFGVLSKSSWLEISRSGAPDREDFSIVRFQLLSKSSGLESPGLAPQTGRISRSGAQTGRISRVSSIKYQVSSIKYQVTSIKYQVSSLLGAKAPTKIQEVTLMRPIHGNL